MSECSGVKYHVSSVSVGYHVDACPGPLQKACSRSQRTTAHYLHNKLARFKRCFAEGGEVPHLQGFVFRRSDQSSGRIQPHHGGNVFLVRLDDERGLALKGEGYRHIDSWCSLSHVHRCVKVSVRIQLRAGDSVGLSSLTSRCRCRYWYKQKKGR